MTKLSVLGLFWQPDSSTAVLNAERVWKELAMVVVFVKYFQLLKKLILNLGKIYIFVYYSLFMVMYWVYIGRTWRWQKRKSAILHFQVYLVVQNTCYGFSLDLRYKFTNTSERSLCTTLCVLWLFQVATRPGCKNALLVLSSAITINSKGNIAKKIHQLYFRRNYLANHSLVTQCSFPNVAWRLNKRRHRRMPFHWEVI